VADCKCFTKGTRHPLGALSLAATLGSVDFLGEEASPDSSTGMRSGRRLDVGFPQKSAAGATYGAARTLSRGCEDEYLPAAVRISTLPPFGFSRHVEFPWHGSREATFSRENGTDDDAGLDA
jgi:hypothetical protein